MTETKLWRVDPGAEGLADDPQIREAAACLARGEIIAFPTETVYGLGGNAKFRDSVRKIYEAKGRPSDNPLIVHVATTEQVREICTDINPMAKKLMDAFWPGPMTLVLPSRGEVSDTVTAGLSTVAVRMPAHPVARALILASGLPIAAPSANSSGHPSPTKAEHVYHDLNGKIAGIIDGGETGVGVESTVVDCTLTPITILRPGGISKEQLEQVAGTVADDPGLTRPDQIPKAPGMKYKHYAPDATMLLVPAGKEKIQELITDEKNSERRVGVLTTEENREAFPEADVVLCCGRRSDLKTVAHRLFAVLRDFNSKKVNVIYSETFPETGIGKAIMNRLSKAAGGRIVE
ncbi:L-threonylcarbamoyladenylate synthase [Sporolactobacillus sp. THM19-2]|jgi:L-threonylcarbamoyladenylate synthase|uniref:L-threonylcarbamoyladenylate synthase n=1 Tax=Sporolactobacillus sp. THM19-2 TaxID=2511171 RepID=UPI00101F8C1B|nr:L-threonylcarbamoyladenylate synthase [Sporolactobacillus sp. THM19-2]RYL94010.1 threonylcarbamoyl-AMP synthase [Sporolactobacillus sp. THM19-2]